MTPRTIVLDANVLMRAVLGRRVDRLLQRFASQVTFLAPEVAFEDVHEHLASVLTQRGEPRALQPALEKLIGRGTRLYDGKDYFTIHDFVKAHHLFSDPEWDGEAVEPEPRVLTTDGKPPTAEVNEPAPTETETEAENKRPAKIKVRLADGKERQLQHMSATSFWSADGRPMSAAQFLESLFGALPEFFKDEDELRRLWGDPDTRRKLLAGLADKGFGREPLAEMQKLIEAENSDLFDVLAYVSFAAPPVTRAERAAAAKAATGPEFTDKQRAFIDFVLAQYVAQGVDELDAEKLSPLLKLKYRNAIADAFAELGRPEQVRRVFVGFQRHLYSAP